MKTKYITDYTEYMQELYPEIDEKAIEEMMKDSFELVRKVLRKERVVRVMKRSSALFGEGFPGTYKIKTIYSRIQGFQVKDKLSNKRRKLANGKDNNK